MPSPNPVIKHGTENTYRRHKCRCDECVDVFRTRQRERRIRAKSRPTPDHVHGTRSGYMYWGCRCGLCVANYQKVHGPWMKEYRARNRERLLAQHRKYYREVYKPRMEAKEAERRAKLLKRGASRRSE